MSEKERLADAIESEEVALMNTLEIADSQRLLKLLERVAELQAEILKLLGSMPLQELVHVAAVPVG